MKNVISLTLTFVLAMITIIAKAQKLVEITELSDSTKTYEYVGDFRNGIALVRGTDMNGLINTKGELLFRTKYKICNNNFNYGNDFVIVQNDGKYGILDTSGEIVVPFQYIDIYCRDGDIAIIYEGDRKYSFVNLKTKEITQIHQYKNVHSFVNGLAWVSTDDWEGYIDRDFNVVIKIENAEIEPFHNGFAKVFQRNESSYYIDTTGKRLMLPNRCRASTAFLNGFAVFRKGRKCGIIDKNGRVIVEPKYRFGKLLGTKPKHNPLNLINYSLVKGKKEYVFDRDGNIVFKFKHNFDFFIHSCDEFLIATPFSAYEYINKDGNLSVRACSFIMDRNGKTYLKQEKYRKIRGLGQNLFVVEKDDKCGVVDLNNNIVLPFEFDNNVIISEGILCLVKDGERRFFRVE